MNTETEGSCLQPNSDLTSYQLSGSLTFVFQSPELYLWTYKIYKTAPAAKPTSGGSFMFSPLCLWGVDCRLFLLGLLDFGWLVLHLGEGNGNPLQYSCLRIPWTEEPGGLLSMGSHRVRHDWNDLVCMHALEKEMAAHSSVLAWRRHDWNDLAAAVLHLCLHLKNPVLNFCSLMPSL